MSPLYDVVRISKHRVRCPNQDIAYQISKSRATDQSFENVDLFVSNGMATENQQTLLKNWP